MEKIYIKKFISLLICTIVTGVSLFLILISRDFTTTSDMGDSAIQFLNLACIVAIIVCWVWYPKINILVKIYKAITLEKIFYTEDIANRVNKSYDVTLRNILKLINDGYLKDYKYLENRVVYCGIENTNVGNANSNINVSKCPNCGAVLNVKKKNVKCEYCNTEFTGK